MEPRITGKESLPASAPPTGTANAHATGAGGLCGVSNPGATEKARLRLLTDRERAVLEALHRAPDLSDAQLGDELGIKAATVRAFLHLIRGKTGCVTRGSLVLWFERLKQNV
jgi:DNA-binding CsgD family transcriptional regulator